MKFIIREVIKNSGTKGRIDYCQLFLKNRCWYNKNRFLKKGLWQSWSGEGGGGRGKTIIDQWEKEKKVGDYG
jgi:hypothetical protein